MNEEFNLRNDLRKQWTMAIGDYMIDKQPEIAIAMRGCMDASLDFFESYLRSRDYVLTNRGEDAEVENLENEFEECQIAEEINQAKQDKSEVEIDQPKQSYLFIFDIKYKLPEESPFMSVDYTDWSISEVADNIAQQNLTGKQKIIIMSDPKWLENGEGNMEIISKLEQLCEDIHRNWPEIDVFLLPIVNLDENKDILKFNNALDASQFGFGDRVHFADLNKYLKEQAPHVFTSDLNGQILDKFLHGLEL